MMIKRYLGVEFNRIISYPMTAKRRRKRESRNDFSFYFRDSGNLSFTFMLVFQILISISVSQSTLAFVQQSILTSPFNAICQNARQEKWIAREARSATPMALLNAMSDREREIRQKIQNLKKKGMIKKKEQEFEGMDEDIDDDDEDENYISKVKNVDDVYSDKIRKKLGAVKSKMLLGLDYNDGVDDVQFNTNEIDTTKIAEPA